MSPIASISSAVLVALLLLLGATQTSVAQYSPLYPAPYEDDEDPRDRYDEDLNDEDLYEDEAPPPRSRRRRDDAEADRPPRERPEPRSAAPKRKEPEAAGRRAEPPSREDARGPAIPPLPEKRGGREAIAAEAPPERPTETPAETEPPPAPAAPERIVLNAPAAETPAPDAPLIPDDDLTKMIGQMLFFGFAGQEPGEPSVRILIDQTAKGRIGGVLLSSRNIVSPQQTARLVAALKDGKAELPLLVGADQARRLLDQEGGRVQRLPSEKGFSAYPSAAELGAAGDATRAQQIYLAMARELREIGVNVNFGPVADLAKTPESVVIAAKARSYGADARRVSAFVRAFAEAHRQAGVLTALKHFPGHGAAAGDTHDGPVDVTQGWDKSELAPYRAAAEGKFGDMVMIGHVRHAQFSGPGGAPASLSRRVVQTLLRGQVGYQGVAITDDLQMRAVSGSYSFEESLILAIAAGNDILLVANADPADPYLPERAIFYIRKAVESGRISRERIRTSYDRIVAIKRRLERMQKAPVAASRPRTPAAASAPAPAAQ
jgi:beta-N-acetylhexosaminidase